MKKLYSRPTVKKSIKGQEVHTEFRQLSDITLPTKEEYDQSYTKALLKLTPKNDLAQLEKHFKNETKVVWSWLFDNLISKYIKDVSLIDFNEVMNYKRLPNGKEKIKWIGKKAEAVYFQKEMKFTMKQFNECFVGNDGKKFAANNREIKFTNKTFIDMLTK